MGFSAGSHLTGHLNVAWQQRTYKRVDGADDLPCKPGQSIMVYPWESVPNAPVSKQAVACRLVEAKPPMAIPALRSLDVSLTSHSCTAVHARSTRRWSGRQA
jgi:hypothetical protein